MEGYDLCESIEILEARKNVLIKIDEGKDVGDNERALYNLSAYIDIKRDINNSIFEMITKTNKINKPITHINSDKEKLYFMPKQYEVLNLLDDYDKLLLSAPTSFGKSMLVKEYIHLNKFNVIFYIVPTNSLAYELEKSYKELEAFSEYTIFDSLKSVDINNLELDKSIFIGTQEKCIELLEIFEGKIDLFVIDEAYKLGDKIEGKREHILSRTFLEQVEKTSLKIILLAPLGNFIKFDDFKFKIIKTNFNAVEKIYKRLTKEKFVQTLEEESLKNKTILFCNSPKDINEYVDLNIQFQASNKLTSLIKMLEKEVSSEWSVVKFLKKGIIIHHGQMPKYIQNKLIDIYLTDKELKLLIGTNSISEGINTPCRNLFISPKVEVTNQNKLLIQNTIGRAGRLGEYPIGEVFTCIETTDLFDETEIVLAISEEINRDEVDIEKNTEKIRAYCEDNNLNYNEFIELLKKHNISFRKMILLIDELSKNLTFGSASDILKISEVVNGSTYISRDYDYINGVLNTYFNYDGEKVYLDNFENMINYIKFRYDKYGEAPPSEMRIIDNYMKMKYNIIEHNLKPLYDLYKDLEGKIFCGENVQKCFDTFFEKYTRKVMERTDYNLLTEIQICIVSRLREYGIPTSSRVISIKMLELIENGLGTRYSMYDIKNVIYRLSLRNNTNDSLLLRDLYNKYF